MNPHHETHRPSPTLPSRNCGRRNKVNKEVINQVRSRERDTLNNSFEISLAMPVFSLTKHDPQKSAVSTCLKSSDLPFNLPPPLTFLQSLRNRCLWFGMPHSAVSLLCMIFMPIKIQVLMMDFFFRGFYNGHPPSAGHSFMHLPACFVLWELCRTSRAPPVRLCLTLMNQDCSWPSPHCLG